MIDLTGQRFGRLTVIAFAMRDHLRHGHWRCHCDCGQTVVVAFANLRSGNTESCGCLRREQRAMRNTTHGATQGDRLTPEYMSWKAVMQRCYNPNAENFKRYGALGVTVCERWRGKNGFINFLADMGKRPAGTTLDRINPHGNYEPGNCRWATDAVQRSNKRSAA